MLKKINKNFQNITIVSNKQMLQKIIKKRTEENPSYLDLSDIHFDDDMPTDMDYQLLTNKAKIVNVSGWNTENFKSVCGFFQNMPNVEKIIGLDTWDVRNIKSMRFMFFKCPKLTDIGDLSNWNLNPYVNVDDMFGKSPNIKIPKIFDFWN